MAQAIFPARQELGFTPSTGVRARIDVRTGAGAVGRAIGQALLAGSRELQRGSVRRAVLEEKNRANLDSLSSRKADKVRDLTNAQISTMKTNTRPEKWEEEALRIVTEGNSQIAGFDFSPDAMAEQQIISDGDLETLPELAFAAGSRAISTATIKSETERLTDDFRSGKEGMAKRTVDFIEAMRNNGLSSEAIVVRIKAAKVAGQKLKTQDIRDGWSDRIAIDPVASEEILEAELTARKTNNGLIPEEDLPSNDIQSLINLANARQVQLEADTAAERNRVQRELENSLYDGLADGTVDVTDVAKSQLDASAKRRLVNDEENFANRTINKTWPLVDNDIAVQRLESLLTSMEGGALDRTELNREINKATVDDGLTKDTRDKFRGLAKKGGRDAVDRAVKIGVDTISNALIRRFTERQSRTIARSLSGELTAREQREASSNAYLLQINRHQLSLIEQEIQKRIATSVEGTAKGRDVVSGNEANKIVADVWEGFRGKSTGDKIADFKAFSAERVPRPDGFPIVRWDKLNDIGKAAVVEAAARGDSTEQILKVIGQ